MITLKIDPEFQNKIPPLTDAEFEQLRENILSDGEVYEPIVVWNGTIIDGHNRWKVIQEHPEIPYRTKDMDFADKWAAFGWMYKKQLGRRNLTNEQRTVLIGKMYEARKQSIGNHAERDEDGKYLSAQNEHIGKPMRTADAIAAELGIGKESVKRAEKFSKGIDALKANSPEAAEKVLSGKSTVTKGNIMNFPELPENEKQEMVSAILNDKPTPPVKESHHRGKAESTEQIQPQTVPPASGYNGGGTKEYREERKQIAAIVADMYDPSTAPAYTVDDMVDEIKLNAEMYISIVRNVLADRSTILTDENRPTVAAALTDVIDQIAKIRRLVRGNEPIPEGA